METPDVTKMQKLVGSAMSVVTAALVVLASFDLLTTEQIAAVMGFLSAFSSALVVADAVIRNGRARVLSNVEALKELERPAAPVVNR